MIQYVQHDWVMMISNRIIDHLCAELAFFPSRGLARSRLRERLEWSNVWPAHSNAKVALVDRSRGFGAEHWRFGVCWSAAFASCDRFGTNLDCSTILLCRQFSKSGRIRCFCCPRKHIFRNQSRVYGTVDQLVLLAWINWSILER